MQQDDIIKPLCPNCGYDLRSTPGDRCSECGQKFIREQLGKSRIPWDCAKSFLFLIPAFFTTLLIMTLRPGAKTLHWETSRSHNINRARGFRRLCALFCGIMMVYLLRIICEATDADLFSAVCAAMDIYLAPWDPGNPLLKELHLLFRCAYDFKPLIYFSAFMLGVDWAFLPGGIFKTRCENPLRLQQIRSLSCYASSLIGFMLLGFITVNVILAIRYCYPNGFDFYRVLALLRRYGPGHPARIAPGLLFIVFMSLAIYRISAWNCLIKGQGPLGGLWAFTRTTVGIAGRTVFWLVLIPLFYAFILLVVISIRL